MKNIFILAIYLLVTGCTANATYLKPSGPGDLYGYCGSPSDVIKLRFENNVYIAFQAKEDKNYIQLNIDFEVPEGNELKVSTSKFIIESTPAKNKISAELVEITSQHAVKNEDGVIIRYDDKKYRATDKLIGQTQRNKSIWSPITGDFQKKYKATIIFKNSNIIKPSNGFSVITPNVILNDKDYAVPRVEFRKVTESFYTTNLCP